MATQQQLTAVQQKRQDQNNSLIELKGQLDTRSGEFSAALPAHMPLERYMRVVLSAVQNNPELLECDRRSFFLSCMRCAQDGLFPDGREAVLVVRKNSNSPTGKSANYQTMVAGIRKKVRNSGEIATLDAYVVREGDEFEYELGDNPFIRHKPALATLGPILAAYSVCTLKSGEKSRDVMSVAEIYKIRDERSDGWKAFKSGAIKMTPWSTDEAEMAKKTVVRRHSKSLPMSTDLDDLIRRGDEDRVADIERPEEPRRATITGRLDQLVDASTDLKPGETITEDGEIIEDKNGDKPKDDKPDTKNVKSEAKDDKAAAKNEKPANADAKDAKGGAKGAIGAGAAAPTKTDEERAAAGYARGVEDWKKGLARRMLPKEYVVASPEAEGWISGWDDTDDKPPADGN